MKHWPLVLAAAACSGCTTLSLERHALSQANSSVDVRYRETMNNLALIADEPSALPAFASIFSGTTNVTDTASMASTTVWENLRASMKPGGFFSDAVNPQLNRKVLQNWALDPVSSPEKLEAMRCACQWVVYGQDKICGECTGLLASPNEVPSTGPHFGVADRLTNLPPNWLHVGRLTDVPADAAYKAHHGSVWVWVMPQGIRGLAEFSLVLLDIARVASYSPSLFNLPPKPWQVRFETSDSHVQAGSDSDGRSIILTATVSLDQNERLVPDTPYYRVRQDNVGSSAKFRSQINAAGATPTVASPAGP